jgi:hypothetical protein
MVIQLALLVAVHEQPAPAVTLTLPVPAVYAYEALVGEIEYVQDPAPACVTVKVFRAIVIVPVRLLPVFAATL